MIVGSAPRGPSNHPIVDPTEEEFAQGFRINVMEQSFLNGAVTLRPGDCLSVVKTIADNSIDSVVTDPPYALVSIVKRFGKTAREDDTQTSERASTAADGYARLSRGFMGSTWDNGSTAFAVDFWREIFRVLKPGGHVAAFSGTRTYHRLAVAIEDAGFEIRDQVGFLYGVGFPKSHDVGKKLDASQKRCSCGENMRVLRRNMAPEDALSGGKKQDVLSSLRGPDDFGCQQRKNDGPARTVRDVREAGLSRSMPPGEDGGGSGLLQSAMLGDDARGSHAIHPSEGDGCGSYTGGEGETFRIHDGAAQSIMEGRHDVSPSARQLCSSEIRSLPAGISDDGASGRLCDGTSACDSEMGRSSVDADGMRSSQRPQPTEQFEIESRTVAGQPQSQNGGVWPYCDRCGKPIIPDGLGTALKPAWEPICLARKPLIGTVAENVLTYGTGALNIDGTRIAISPSIDDPRLGGNGDWRGDKLGYGGTNRSDERHPSSTLGRWPANIVTDGSHEVLSAFPDVGGSGVARELKRNAKPGRGDGYHMDMGDAPPSGMSYADSGSAARFFYSAKADKGDRLGSKHPTVKPVDLMRWLCRLVTPPGGLVLDPFAGTGTTGEAAYLEGFRAVLIEREPEYLADIARRMALVTAGPTERKIESVKARGDVAGAGPLFGEAA